MSFSCRSAVSAMILPHISRFWQLSCYSSSIKLIPPITLNSTTMRTKTTQSNKISNDTIQGSKSKKIDSHIYNSIYPWATKTQLAEHLLQSKICDNCDILVLNKPYGLGQNPVASGGKKRSYGRNPPSGLTIADIMPTLKEMTGIENLNLELSPEKWNSGVMVLSKSKSASRAVTYSVRIARERHQCSRSYWALTRNAPYPRVQHLKFCSSKQESGSTVGPVVVNEPSGVKIKRRELQPFYVAHNTLGEGLDAALVEMSVSSTKHNSVRLWLSHCLAPVLGDFLFGSRVAYILGRPTATPIERANALPTPHSYEFLEKLGILPSISDLMPLFVHLRTVTLPDFIRIAAKGSTIRKRDDRKGQHAANEYISQQRNGPSMFNVIGDDLILSAECPPHFQWTMDQLGITSQDIKLDE